jgi:hypothetical protein
MVYWTLQLKSYLIISSFLTFVPQMYRCIYTEILEQISCTTAPEYSLHEGELLLGFKLLYDDTQTPILKQLHC